jgi:putative MFS transporter
VPNFVRGSLIPINYAFLFFVTYFKSKQVPGTHSTAMINSGYIMMGILTLIALFALSQLKESFGKDLDYVEE